MVPKCDLRATDFMKLRRINLDRVIEDVEPPKKKPLQSKSLTDKFKSASRRGALLLKLNPNGSLKNKEPSVRNSSRLSEQLPAIEDVVTVKLSQKTD